jgi:hypothetical protein
MIDGMTALEIAIRMKGQWNKKPGERDTAKVKRIWKLMHDTKAEVDLKKEQVGWKS